MGNCLNAASKRRHHGMLPEEEEESLSEMRRISHLLRLPADDHDDEEDVVEEAEAPAAAEGLKVKIVLTRGELEWLMAQLKSGEQRLQDVLHHVHALSSNADKHLQPAAAAAGWRPRLESIVECPETPLTLMT